MTCIYVSRPPYYTILVRTHKHKLIHEAKKKKKSCLQLCLAKVAMSDLSASCTSLKFVTIAIDSQQPISKGVTSGPFCLKPKTLSSIARQERSLKPVRLQIWLASVQSKFKVSANTCLRSYVVNFFCLKCKGKARNKYSQTGELIGSYNNIYIIILLCETLRYAIATVGPNFLAPLQSKGSDITITVLHLDP